MPPDDVYLMGWNPLVRAAHSGATLLLFSLPDRIRLFEYREGEGVKTEAFPPGSGFLVKKGQQLELRFRIGNSGPDSETHGAVAYLHFVPAANN